MMINSNKIGIDSDIDEYNSYNLFNENDMDYSISSNIEYKYDSYIYIIYWIPMTNTAI